MLVPAVRAADVSIATASAIASQCYAVGDTVTVSDGSAVAVLGDGVATLKNSTITMKRAGFTLLKDAGGTEYRFAVYEPPAPGGDVFFLNLTDNANWSAAPWTKVTQNSERTFPNHADDVAVMYCGQVVELAPKSKIFGRGKYLHPYTEGLLSSTPTAKKRERLETIAGSVPLPWELPKGCKFAPRCPYRTEKCLRDEPKLAKMQEGQWVRCHYAEKEVRRGEEHARFIVR